MTSRIAVVIALFLAGFGCAWVVQGWRFEARISAMTAAQRTRDAQAAQAYAEAERQNRERLQAAQAAADQAVTTAQARADAANRKTLEITHELAQVTTGRPCLGAAARSLLEQSPAFGHRPGLRLPAAAASPPSTAAAATPDPSHGQTEPKPVSSDRDLANWITQASALYETCRARVDGLREWADGSAQAAAPPGVNSGVKSGAQ